MRPVPLSGRCAGSLVRDLAPAQRGQRPQSKGRCRPRLYRLRDRTTYVHLFSELLTDVPNGG